MKKFKTILWARKKLKLVFKISKLSLNTKFEVCHNLLKWREVTLSCHSRTTCFPLRPSTCWTCPASWRASSTCFAPSRSRKCGTDSISILRHRVFIKYCVFPQNVVIFLKSASSAAALLVFYLPGVCTHTDTEVKQRKARVRNILKSVKKLCTFLMGLYP